MGVARSWGISGVAFLVLGSLFLLLGAGQTRAASGPALTCASAGDIVERPNGEILVLADRRDCRNARPQVVQFDSSGRLDSDYGQGGVATSPTALNLPDGIDLWPRRLLLRPDGGTLIVSYDQLVALGPDGSPDTSFGSGGIVNIRGIAPSGAVAIASAAVQPDGKVLVFGGQSFGPPISISRYLPSGQIDASFGVGGTAVIELPPGPGGGPAAWSGDGDVATGASGDIFIGMGMLGEFSERPAVVRLDDSGEPVTSYGGNGDGFAVAPIPYEPAMIDSVQIKVRNDGSVSLLGHGGVGAKLLAHGYRADFGASGTPESQNWNFGSLPTVIDSGNRVLGIGNFTDQYLGEENSLNATRYQPDGSPDHSFGTTGKGVFRAYIGTAGAGAGHAVELLSGNGYLIAGSASGSLTVVKLDDSGRLDETFGQYDGLATVPGINCPLGTGATSGPTWVSPHRCRISGGSFDLGASIRHASKRPSLGIRVGGLGHQPSSGEEFNPAENWKVVTVKLPASIRLRSPKQRNLIRVKRTGGPKVFQKDLTVKKNQGRFQLTLKVRGNVEKPATTTFTLKRGSFRLRSTRKRVRKLRIRATVEQGGTPNPERISTRSTTLKVKKEKVTGITAISRR